MNVRELCQRDIAIVQPETAVTEAARLMVTLGVGSVVVGRNERVCGILTDRDIVVRGVHQKRDIRQLPVSELMTANPVTIDPDADVTRATRLMADKGIRRLPVVDVNGQLIGILALDDVIVLVGAEMANVRAAVTAARAR